MEAALAWFDATYQREPWTGTWQRTALPASGGVGEQDAWLMSALEVLRRAAAVLDADEAVEAKRDRALAAARGQADDATQEE